MECNKHDIAESCNIIGEYFADPMGSVMPPGVMFDDTAQHYESYNHQRAAQRAHKILLPANNTQTFQSNMFSAKIFLSVMALLAPFAAAVEAVRLRCLIPIDVKYVSYLLF